MLKAATRGRFKDEVGTSKSTRVVVIESDDEDY